jgi:hypothetical protein
VAGRTGKTYGGRDCYTYYIGMLAHMNGISYQVSGKLWLVAMSSASCTAASVYEDSVLL